MRGFRELLAASGHALTVPQLDLMEFHYDLLVRWAPRVNLTTVSGVEEIAKRHFVESLTVASVLPPGELSVVDAGSGAGFPGFPIAAVRPECRVSLLDSDLKKYVFLREVAERYPNVKVFRGRFEDFQEKCYGRFPVRCAGRTWRSSVRGSHRTWRSWSPLMTLRRSGRQLPDGWNGATCMEFWLAE